MATLATATAGSAFGATELPENWPWERTDGKRYGNKVVLITGATSGIGGATARAFAAEGARVFFCGRRRDLGESVAKSIREAGPPVRYHRAHVREEADVRAFVEACVRTYGRIRHRFQQRRHRRAGGSSG